MKSIQDCSYEETQQDRRKLRKAEQWPRNKIDEQKKYFTKGIDAIKMNQTNSGPQELGQMRWRMQYKALEIEQTKWERVWGNLKTDIQKLFGQKKREI